MRWSRAAVRGEEIGGGLQKASARFLQLVGLLIDVVSY